MAAIDHTPETLVRAIPVTFPQAVQAVAALEDRIRLLRSHPESEWAIADAHAALVSLREMFGLWPRPAVPVRDDTTPQLLQYQAEGR